MRPTVNAVNQNIAGKALFSVIIFITSILPYSAKAQDQHIIDSLKAVIDAAEHDTLACDAYQYLGEQFTLSNLDTALILWQKHHEIVKRNLETNLPALLRKKYMLSLSNCLNNLGYIYWREGNLQKSLEYQIKSLEIRENIDYKDGIATSLNNIGHLYSLLGNIPKALECLYQSFKIREKMGDKKGTATSLNNIALIYQRQDDLQKALELFQECLKLHSGMNNKRGISTFLNNIAIILDKQGDAAKAFQYYFKSLKIRQELGYKSGVALIFNNIGSLYRRQGDIQRAIKYYYKSLNLNQETGFKDGISLTSINLGISYLDMDMLDSAENNLKRALNLGMEIGSPLRISASSMYLSRLDKRRGSYQKALKMYELHILMRDSIKNEATQKATIRQQTKYEFEKAQLIKEQEEKDQARIQAETTSRRDNLQYSIVLICLLGIGVLVAMLGKLSLSVRMAEGIIFFSFLILFEFLLVLADPYIDRWSNGAPGIKLLFNAALAALIFPLHSLFESKMKRRLL